jgi:TolB-like protein
LDGANDDRGGVQSGGTLPPGVITALIAEMLHAEPADPSPPLTPGARVGRYAVIRRIGRGGFGAVYEAHDGALHRLVALKMFHAATTEADVGREGEAAARLAHPNIATVHDAGIDEGRPYLVYELLAGETLASRLARGALPAREALGVAAQVARALVHAHAAGVVHRDLKPANVFLSAAGNVKVLDFGVALLFGRDVPPGGTPAYMAPEQRSGEPGDARSDLYALGLLLREMLTGERGSAGDPVAAVPPPARRIVSALLAEDPAARPRSASAALAEIEAAVRGPDAPPFGARRIALVSALGAALAGTLAVAFLRHERAGSGTMADASSSASIAVLPFADVSPPGKALDYFAEGLSEEILNALAHVDGLRVAGRSSAFSFKDRKAADVGRALHVGAVLEGTVRREGDRIRIAARIVNAADGSGLWSESFDRDLTGVFEVQDEIVRRVLEALRVKVAPGHGPRIAGAHTASPEAYRRYLLGRHFFNLGTTEGFRRAADELEQAIALDDRYAPAYAWLATALLNSTLSETAATRLEPMQRALAAGEKAVALGPDLAESYSARGWMRTSISWDWAGAQADLDRALALNPADTSALVRRGALFAVLGRLPEAIAITRRATEVDPLYAFGWVFLAGYYNAIGRTSLARDAVTRALDIAPRHSYGLRELGWTYLLNGDPRAALAVFESHPWTSVRLTGIAIAHHELGHEAKGQQALDELRQRFGHGEAYQIALVYAARGDTDAAFEWLDRAFTERNQRLRYMKFDPLLRNIRGDPRYAALVERMGLPAE